MNSIFNLMLDGKVRDEKIRRPYKDVLTLDLSRFEHTQRPFEHTLTLPDLHRPDLLMYKYYSLAMYDDIVMLINGIGHLKDKDSEGNYIHLGKTIYIPVLQDVEAFYVNEVK